MDGEDVAASSLAGELRAAGFIPGIKGFLKRGATPPPGMHSRPPRGVIQGPLGPDLEEPALADEDDA